jgi:parallel beta helix pectate lyase-like protein
MFAAGRTSEIPLGERAIRAGQPPAIQGVPFPGQPSPPPALSPVPTNPADAAPPQRLSVPVCKVQLLPTSPVQPAIDSNPPGTSFCFLRGTYRVSSLRPKNGDSFLGQLTSVLTGDGSAKYAFQSKASRVTVAGLVIERFNSPLQQGALQLSGPGWTIRDNEIRNNAALGAKLDGGGTFVRNYVHHNGQLGIGSYQSTGLLVEDNEIAYNNTRNVNMDWEAGGGKFVDTTYLTIRDNYVHDNRGPGLWTDTNNYKTVIERNHVIDNAHTGIFHEISYDAVIRDNVVTGNARSWRNGIWRAGIVIANSSNVEVYGNTLSGNGNGIAGTEQQRGSGSRGEWLLRNLNIHDNILTMSRGQTGLETLSGDDVFGPRARNRFRKNTYYLRSPDCACFRWRHANVNKSRWVAAGQDRAGTFYTR